MLKSPAEFKVRLGEHNLKIDEGTEQLLPVSRVVMHENYNEQKTEHDIALLRLARDVKYSAAIKPACLPRKDVEADKLCVVTGWGSTKGRRTRHTVYYRPLLFRSKSQVECQRRFQEFLKGVGWGVQAFWVLGKAGPYNRNVQTDKDKQNKNKQTNKKTIR